MPTLAVDADAVRGMRTAVDAVARRTPVLPSATLSAHTRATVALKAESLQVTGSFKVRGALAKLDALGPAAQAGVVCGSAGNHAQALAYAARARGVPCVVFMPTESAIGKLQATRALGAAVHLTDGSVDTCVAAAREHAEAAGQAFVHPFDDPDVIAGQGTLALELVEAVDDLAAVLVPIGGGGLISGISVALRALAPGVRIVGVQAQACAPVAAALAGGAPAPVDAPALSIADGIAVKRPGALTMPIIDALVDEVVAVTEDEIADAMVLALERSKLVVEGAGAVGIAALHSGRITLTGDGTTVVVVSGGNVDAGLLAAVARRHETREGRRLVLRTRVADRPGALAALLTLVGETGANIVAIEHLREGFDLHVRETGVQLVLETRGPEHTASIGAAVRAGGYAIEVGGEVTPG